MSETGISAAMPLPEETDPTAEQPGAITIEESDAGTIRQLIEQWKQQLGYPKSWDLDGILDYQPFDTAFVARKNNKPVGAVTLQNNQVIGLYVLPDERGNGYAESLLKQAVAYGETRGFKKLNVEVADTRAETLVRKLMTDPAYADRFEITEAYRD